MMVFRDKVELSVADDDLVKCNGFLASQALEGEGDGRDPDAGDRVPGLEEGSGKRIVIRQYHVPENQCFEGEQLHPADGQFAFDPLIEPRSKVPGQGCLDPRGL